MNYEQNYYDYINYVKSLNRQKLRPSNENYVYYEEHHIKPKSIYPELKDDPNNKVLLTAREHFLAHYLLCKIYKNNKTSFYKMLCAFQRMTKNTDGTHYINSRLYEKLKIEKSKTFGELTKNRWKDGTFNHRMIDKMVKTRKENGSYNKSNDTKEKIKESLKLYYLNHPEAKQHLRDVNINKRASVETKQKMSNSRKGHKVSEETKAKLRLQHSTGKAVRNITKDILYPSVLFAEKQTGITRQRIKSCIENNKCDLNGDFWKYE